MSPKEPILVLHLSDLHFGSNSRFAGADPEAVADCFFRAVGDARKRLNLGAPVSLVIMSGDVAEAARPKEYEIAETFFVSLAQRLQLMRRRFVFIPGNHDVSWPACKRVEADQEEEGFDDEELRRRFDRDKLLNFENFVQKFYGVPIGEVAVTLERGARVYDVPDLEVSVAGLNSCEAESHWREDHKGLLSEAQAQALMEHWRKSKRNHWLRIITVHHNPVTTVLENIDQIMNDVKQNAHIEAGLFERYASDLVGFRGREYLERIAEDCAVQVILHGHHHAADEHLWSWRGREGHTHIFSAGSGTLAAEKLPRDHPNTLRLVSLDPARERISSWILEYRPHVRAKGTVALGGFVPTASDAYERALTLPTSFPRSQLLVEHARDHLQKTLEAIRKGQLKKARSLLQKLEESRRDLPEELFGRVLYNRACIESRHAERISRTNAEHNRSLEQSVRYLGSWIKHGINGAWKKEGRTPRNEIYRMGNDIDLRYVLVERRDDVAAAIPKRLRSALPKHLPPEVPLGGGGGCIPRGTPVRTPKGLTPVEHLREGDQIVSLDLNSPFHLLVTRITRICTSSAHSCVLLNNRFLFTPDQPLYLRTGVLIRAAGITSGIELLNHELKALLVDTVELAEDCYEIYNLETAHRTHNYVAHDLLCHNKYLSI